MARSHLSEVILASLRAKVHCPKLSAPLCRPVWGCLLLGGKLSRPCAAGALSRTARAAKAWHTPNRFPSGGRSLAYFPWIDVRVIGLKAADATVRAAAGETDLILLAGLKVGQQIIMILDRPRV